MEETEPPSNTALTQHPNIICTPHLGASTTEAQTRVAEEIAQQFVDLRDGKSLFGAINAQAMSQALSPSTKPWVSCGQALGVLAATLAGKVDSTTKVRVTTQGSALENSRYMSAAVLSGLLRDQSSVPLNLINAPALAKASGIAVETDHSGSKPCSESLVTVTLETGNSQTSVAGYAAGTTVYLCCVSGLEFSQHVALKGSVLLVQGVNVQDVLGALSAPPSSFSRTRAQAGDQADWFAFHVTPGTCADKLKSKAKHSVNF